MRILVIEDERATARIYSEWLIKAGHEVRIATSGTEALAVANSWQPEGVLLDLILPDISGIEVLVCIRMQLPGVPVVACTNGFIPVLIETAVANGAAHIFDKSTLTAHDLALKFEEIARH